jgi:xanthine dehydrogenase molybdenum-binding subunit
MACAEALSFLGISPDDITWVNRVDTETGLRDCVETDSVVSFMQAELMPEIAARVKVKILELAAPELEIPAEELDIEEGWVFIKKEPEKRIAVKELLWTGDMVPILVTVSRMPNSAMTGVPYGCMFVEVEVDTETGKVNILKMVICNDLGTVMFPAGAEGQQVGGQCIGLGESLTEEIIYDEGTGVPLNFNLIDYKVPTILDFPQEIQPILMEVWRGAGEYGACGLGEGAMSWTPTAICNAVYNAVGVRIYDPPIKPEKLLRAMAEK